MYILLSFSAHKSEVVSSISYTDVLLHLVDFREQMTGDNQCHFILRRRGANQFPHFLDSRRIQSICRLIQNQQAWKRQKGGSKAKPLLHSQGIYLHISWQGCRYVPLLSSLMHKSYIIKILRIRCAFRYGTVLKVNRNIRIQPYTSGKISSMWNNYRAASRISTFLNRHIDRSGIYKNPVSYCSVI